MSKRVVFVLVILLLTAVCAVPSLIAQGDLDVTIESVSDAEYPDIELMVVPTNQSGVPIPDLLAESFRISDESGPVEDFEVEPFSDVADQISIMLVLDVSGSMKDDLEALREGSDKLLDSLEPHDKVGLIAFGLQEDGTTVSVTGPLSGDREVDLTTFPNDIRNPIILMEIGDRDGTPLYDAIYRGTSLTSKVPAGERRVVIVMTDGVDSDRDGNVDQGSEVYDRNTVIDEIRGMDVPVYTIGLGDDIDDAFLQRVSNATGGQYLHTPDADQLGELFEGVADSLRQKYRLNFASETSADNGKHEFNVHVDSPLGSGSQEATYTAHYPETPSIQSVRAALPREDFSDLDSLSSVMGYITLEADVVARDSIQEVEYFLDGKSIGVAEEPPWSIVWDTTSYAASEPRMLSVQARDNQVPPNENEPEEIPVKVDRCNLICLIEGTTGIDARIVLGGVALLLVLFALILWLLRRTRRTEYVPVTPEPEPEFFVPPPAPPPEPQPTEPQLSSTPTVGVDVSGAAGFPYQSASSPKTEVLYQKPDHMAYLIDPETQRTFPLDEITSIGRDPNNDIVLDDTAVSGEHAKIRLKDGEFELYDLASTNPVQVNGETIVHYVLQDGDKLSFGRKVLIYRRVPDVSNE